MNPQDAPDSTCRCERCDRQIPMSPRQVQEGVKLNHCPVCLRDIELELEDLDFAE